MNKFFRLLIFMVFGLTITSCDNKQTSSESRKTTDAKTEIGKVNNVLSQYEVPSQIFKVSADKATQVNGKRGTIISINPADLVTDDGQPLGKNIEVELKELTNQEQLLRANAQTTSNGQLLISGGAYYINLTSDGQQLKLKDGKTLSVEFPKLSNTEMSLFYGQRDSLGQMNWQQAKQKFESRTKQKITNTSNADTSIGELDAILKYIESESKRPLTPEEKKQIEEHKKNNLLVEKVYKAIQLNQLGWINCDRFYEIPNKTDLLFTFDDKDSIISANIYLVFKDINSVMQTSYFSFADKEFNSGFQNIPIGAKTQLIAFSIKNGKTYTYKADLILKANETIQLTLKETDQTQIDKLFQSN